MTDFVSTWNEESFLTTPVAPLGLIAMRGTEDMGDKVNKWLLKWRKYTEETLPGDMSTTPGMGREDFLVRATCPRFGNGEGKGLIKDWISTSSAMSARTTAPTTCTGMKCRCPPMTTTWT